MEQLVGRILLQLGTGINLPDGRYNEDEGKGLLTLIGKICSKYRLLGKMIKQLINREASA